MSATRDKSQKIAFVYSNLYDVYKKGKNAACEASVDASLSAGLDAPVDSGAPVALRRARAHVIKAGDRAAEAAVSVETPAPARKVTAYNPIELIGKRLPRPDCLPPSATSPANPAIQDLKTNLKTLTDLHSRLRFMLQELEELVKD